MSQQRINLEIEWLSKEKGAVVVIFWRRSLTKTQCLAVVSTMLRGRIKQNNMDIQDVLSSRLEEGFTCLSSSTSADFWYIDSEALAHITRV